MIGIEDMKNIAAAKKEAEKKVEEDKFKRNLAINKCPVCGGWVKVESEVKVEYCFHDDYESLDSTDNEIVEQIYQKTPIKAYCIECGATLDVTYTDAEKHEFTLRAEV